MTIIENRSRTRSILSLAGEIEIIPLREHASLLVALKATPRLERFLSVHLSAILGIHALCELANRQREKEKSRAIGSIIQLRFEAAQRDQSAKITRYFRPQRVASSNEDTRALSPSTYDNIVADKRGSKGREGGEVYTERGGRFTPIPGRVV